MLFSGSTFPIHESANLLPAKSSLKAPKRDYTKRGILLGSKFNQPYADPGRKLLVTVPQDYPENTLQTGLHHGLTVGHTRDGFPRIQHGEDDGYVYLVLSSKHGESENGIGTIRIPRSQGLCRMASIKGTSKRFPDGRWQDVIVRAYPGETFLVSWTSLRNHLARSLIYHIVSPDNIIVCRRENLHKAFRQHSLNPATLPFETWWYCGESKIKRSDWRSI